MTTYTDPKSWHNQRLLLIICIIALVVSGYVLLSNPIKEKAESNTKQSSVDVDTIYEFRNSYIGDSTKTIGVARNLIFPEGISYHSIELQSS